ncbi:MAG: hypothetical protein Q4D61_03900 [Cardiobacteriaceae bacterium]|nr:hypothetical protein [Cardiobacteriaceae bacterium]
MELLLSFTFATVWMALAYFPGAVDAPQYAQTLEAARAPVVGDNGADALYALEQLPDWPQALPRCQGEEDCLAVAREHLEAYRALPAETRDALNAYDATLAELNRYGHFRYFVTLNDPIPPFHKLIAANSFNAYRHADGDSDAALQSACLSASVARTLLASQNTLIDSMIGYAQLLKGTQLIAQIRAEKPELPWPAACDGVQSLPREHFAVCPLLYGEWYMMRSSMADIMALQHPEEEWTALFTAGMARLWNRQLIANAAYKASRNCEADILAAVARDEALAPVFTAQEERKHCAPFNLLCDMAMPDYGEFQVRLLNAYRVLVAFDALRHPEKPLPDFLQREDGALVLHLHPARDRATRVVLPLGE